MFPSHVWKPFLFLVDIVTSLSYPPSPTLSNFSTPCFTMATACPTVSDMLRISDSEVMQSYGTWDDCDLRSVFGCCACFFSSYTNASGFLRSKVSFRNCQTCKCVSCKMRQGQFSCRILLKFLGGFWQRRGYRLGYSWQSYFVSVVWQRAHCVDHDEPELQLPMV